MSHLAPESDSAESSSPITNPMKNYRPTRSHFRARSHDSAHSEDAQTTVRSSPPEHPLIPRGDADLITAQRDLESLVADLRAGGSFAYDSEFIGELTYIPKLCLIQVASSTRVALIDPLAKIDLTPFWELLCDDGVEKIVHAGSQDLEPVFRHLQQTPANVFDTQISSGFIGMTYPVALSKLVREIIGVSLGKGLTFSHWDQRPLSAMQLRYAADDVRYLPAVRAAIGSRLEALGHTAWAAEECASLCEPSLYRFDPDVQFRRVRGWTSLNPAGLAILRELVGWRDVAARNHDVPPRAFLKDEILVDLARNPVKTVDKLVKIRGLPRPIELTHGGEIVAAIARGANVPHADLPVTKQREETPTEKFRADALWAAAECLSLGRSIDPNLIANRQEIGQLYRHLAGGEEANDLRILNGWRRAAIGEPLMALVQNNARINLTWESGALRAAKGA